MDAIVPSLKSPPFGSAGDVLEDNGAVIFGLDYATTFVRDGDIVERDSAVALGFDRAAVYNLTVAALAEADELDPAVVLRRDFAARFVGDGDGVRIDALELYEAVILGFDLRTGLVLHTAAGELIVPWSARILAPSSFVTCSLEQLDDAVVLGGDEAGIVEIAV